MYGAITLYRATFQKLPLTRYWLKGYSPFARRYWGNLGWFLFLWVLRYFSSPSLPLHPMYSGADTAGAVGFPIRKSPDQSLFADSPKLNAGYNVLHRLWLPRHPPCTLSHLTIQPQEVLYVQTTKVYVQHFDQESIKRWFFAGLDTRHLNVYCLRTRFYSSFTRSNKNIF